MFVALSFACFEASNLLIVIPIDASPATPPSRGQFSPASFHPSAIEAAALDHPAGGPSRWFHTQLLRSFNSALATHSLLELHDHPHRWQRDYEPVILSRLEERIPSCEPAKLHCCILPRPSRRLSYTFWGSNSLYDELKKKLCPLTFSMETNGPQGCSIL